MIFFKSAVHHLVSTTISYILLLYQFILKSHDFLAIILHWILKSIEKNFPTSNLNTLSPTALLSWLLYNWFIEFYKVYFGDLHRHSFKLTDLLAKWSLLNIPGYAVRRKERIRTKIYLPWILNVKRGNSLKINMWRYSFLLWNWKEIIKCKE